MKKVIFCVLTLSFLPFVVGAQSALFTRDLKLGDRGPDVLSLQKLLNKSIDTEISSSGLGSPNQETDYFGALTKAAVIKFQNKYRSEVLYPGGIFVPTGYVGSMTRAKLSTLASPPVSSNPPSQTQQQKTKKPVVLSVSPNRVRPGDVVTVTGENFTPFGNRVSLGDGPILKLFESIPSSDGKTLLFIYKPPIIKSMSETEIRALPSDIVQQIEGPIKAAGGSLADATSAYKGLNSESELQTMIQKNGLNADAVLYHHFWVTVENSNGKGATETAQLYGMRKFPFDNVADDSIPSLFSRASDGVRSFVENLIPTAHAQYGGGFTSGVVFVCTCSGSLLTFQLGITGLGTGLYAFPPGFVPLAGSGLVAGPWLGGFIMGAGTCTFYIVFGCAYIPANLPMNPVGYAL